MRKNKTMNKMEQNKLSVDEVLTLSNEIEQYCIDTNYLPYRLAMERLNHYMVNTNWKTIMEVVVYYKDTYYQLFYYGRTTKKYGLKFGLVALLRENDKVRYLTNIEYNGMAGYVFFEDERRFYEVKRKIGPSYWRINNQELLDFYISENPTLKYMSYDLDKCSLSLFDWIEMYRINDKLELYSKIGLSNLMKDSRFLNIKDKDVLKFIRSNSDKIVKHNLKYVDIMALGKEQDVTIEEYLKFIKVNRATKYSGSRLELLSHLTLKDKIKYINRFDDSTEMFKLLSDYQKLAKEYHIKEMSPINLKQAHDELVARKSIDDQLALEQENKSLKVKLKSENIKYKRKIKPYKSLEFPVIDNMRVVLLDDILEVKKDGDMLKHCVYTNRYYERNSLLLSVRDTSDNPIETIEINLQGIPSVEQIRGYRNQDSDYHDKIVSAINSLLPSIKQIKEFSKVV